jgi:hypothetical protein
MGVLDFFIPNMKLWWVPQHVPNSTSLCPICFAQHCPLKTYMPEHLGNLDTNYIIFRNFENFPKKFKEKNCEGKHWIFKNISFVKIQNSKWIIQLTLVKVAKLLWEVGDDWDLYIIMFGVNTSYIGGVSKSLGFSPEHFCDGPIKRCSLQKQILNLEWPPTN